MVILVPRKNANVTEGVDWAEMLDFCRHCSNSTFALRSIKWLTRISWALTQGGASGLTEFLFETAKLSS